MNVALLRAWAEYHVRAEEFDRTLPGAWSERDPDEWMPFPHVRGQSIVFARRLLAELRTELLKQGIEMRFRDPENREVLGLRHEGRKDLLKVLSREGEVFRASGDAICEICGKPYRQHPFTEDRDWNGEPYLNKACDGRLLHL